MLGLSNRETALALWVLVIAAYAVIDPRIRPASVGVLKAATPWKLWVPLVTFAMYITTVTWAARQVGWWDVSLLGPTLFWFLTVALGLFLGSNAATKNKLHYRRIIAGTVGGLALLEVLAGLYSFPIIVELILQGVIGFVAMVSAFAARQPNGKAAAKASNFLLGVAGVTILTFSISHLVSDVRADDMDWLDLGRGTFLPIWMTVAAALFLWPLSLMMAYEKAYVFLKIAKLTAMQRRRARFALMVACGPRTTQVGRVNMNTMIRMGHAATVRESIAEYRVWRAEQDEKERPLPPAKAEAKATRDALTWLSTCHMGWHRRREGTYRPDLIDILEDDFAKKGLPEDHGVRHEVSPDGRAWRAWRQMADGRYVGIGAAVIPQEEWHYEGHSAPTNFPPSPNWFGPLAFAAEGSFWD